MNGLYKRYIPPKAAGATSATTTLVQAQPATATANPAVGAENEKKRKRERERSQEEVAERKAKKLRKKGIDPATVQNVATTVAAVQVQDEATSQNAVVSRTVSVPKEDEVKAANAAAEARGDFSHITNTKKRHKLEKQARKAGLRVAGAIGAPKQEAATEPEPETELQVEDVVAEEVFKKWEVEVEDKTEREREVETERERDGEREASAAERVESTPKVLPKRRHKLESVLAGGVEDASVLDARDDTHMQKYSSVLGKFKKSAKRSPVPEETGQTAKPALETVDRLEMPDAAPDDFVPDEESQKPQWLREPILIDSKTERVPWTELRLDPLTCDRLKKLTFDGALPIQQALVPLLIPPGIPGAKYLPGSEKVLPDIVVSAPTGSGKTVSYLLPITEALRRSSTVPAGRGKLGAVIVVPTQELVTQVAAVAESLSKGSRIKVGQSNSKHSLRDEQKKLVKRRPRYDPAEYRRLMELADLALPRNCPSDARSPEYAAWLEASQPDAKTAQQMETVLGPAWVADFVPTYDSVVDIFVTTPQRLQDHIDDTPGFTLEHLTWLVLDEADRMLDNQHRTFLDMLNQETHRELHVYREYSGERPLAYQPPRLRKVILSATIPSDVKVEYAFQLRFPKLVVERGAEDEAQADCGAQAYARRAQATGEVHDSGDIMELPRTLVEYLVPVGDGSEKPLVAIELLKSRILKGSDFCAPLTKIKHSSGSTTSASDSESQSESESDVSSVSSSESDSSSDDSDASSTSGVDSARTRKKALDKTSAVPSQSALSHNLSGAQAPTILLFTSSTEAANRLTHLFQALVPSWKPYLTTILKGQPRRTKLKASDPALVISTDRAGRGLDGFTGRMFTHVIQYDVPRSATDYVHRVGRTARAGRGGEAWTLSTHKQAGWFKEEIVKSRHIVRAGSVEDVKVSRASEEMRDAYRGVLATMKEEVEGGRARR